MIHTTRERKRNASGGVLDGKAGTLIPILGGIAGGTAAVLAGRRFNTHPGLVAAGTASAGLAAMSFGKQPWLRQAGAGCVVGAAVVGAVPLVVGAFDKHPQQQQQGQATPRPAPLHRMAEGDGYVTRGELNDALGKLADSHRETQKQQTCDLMTALRDEIRKVVAEGPNGPGLPASSTSTAQPLPSRPSNVYPLFPPPRVTNDMRGADGDEYVRNAYGDDIRDAVADEYERNAYGDDIRDASVDEYERNAYGDDMRDASVYDERDASVYDERDAGAYDERDASVYDERDAGAYDERDASVYDERDASPYDERDADGDQLAQMTGGTSM